MGGMRSVFEIPLLLSFSYLFGEAELHESAYSGDKIVP